MSAKVLYLAHEKAGPRRFSGEPPTGFGELGFPLPLRTPGEARAFLQGFTDHPRWIGPDSLSYRDGFALAEKRALNQPQENDDE